MSKNSIVFPSLELPLNIAHRGASMQAPENTFMAFELATTLGAHVLELDVYLSRDGEVVVFHDETLERTTNGEGPLAALSLNELQALDAAYHFKTQQGENPFRNRGIFMPRLVEVLRAFPEMSFNIESKGKDPALVDALLGVLDEVGPSSVLLTAGEDEIMTALEGAKTGLPLGLSISQAGQIIKQPTPEVLKPFAGRVLQIPPRHPKYYLGLRSLLSKRLVKALREASVELHLWTINDMHEARSYLDKGVQGIITDDPASLANLLWNRQNKADS